MNINVLTMAVHNNQQHFALIRTALHSRCAAVSKVCPAIPMGATEMAKPISVPFGMRHNFVLPARSQHRLMATKCSYVLALSSE